MPKKTKKEKIIAEFRRKLDTVKTDIPNIQPQKSASDTLTASSYFNIVNDLRKTFLLTILAIGFELVIYLFWR